MAMAKRFSAFLCALFVVGLLAPALAGAWSTPDTLSGAGQTRSTPTWESTPPATRSSSGNGQTGRTPGSRPGREASAGTLSGVQNPPRRAERLRSPGRGRRRRQRRVHLAALRRDRSEQLLLQPRPGAGANCRRHADCRADPLGSRQERVRTQVAVDGDGDAVFTWTRYDAAFTLRAQARARASNGTLTPAQTLSPRGQAATGPRSRSTPTATPSSPGTATTGRIRGSRAERGRPTAPEHGADPFRGRAEREHSPGRGRHRRRRRLHLATVRRHELQGSGAGANRRRRPERCPDLSAAGEDAGSPRSRSTPTATRSSLAPLGRVNNNGSCRGRGRPPAS